ncbi:single-stranded DNA-binding protein [bacterium]|nr:single-stranded DNA-binding protein [bacterium]
MNLNKVFILGNLTRDPERKSLPSGQSVTSFGVATNRFFTNQQGEKKQEVEFHNIVLFGRLAETAYQYLKKGSLVLIEGRIKTRNWQDQNNFTHYKTEIIAERLQLGPKNIQVETDFDKFDEKEKRKNDISEEEIPVIEEDKNLFQDQDKNTDQEQSKEEIDVKDIPF